MFQNLFLDFFPQKNIMKTEEKVNYDINSEPYINAVNC